MAHDTRKTARARQRPADRGARRATAQIEQVAEVGLAELAALAPSIIGNQERFSLPRDRLATLRELEEEYIAWMIERCGGNKTKAAEVLGIDPSTLHRRTRPRR